MNTTNNTIPPRFLAGILKASLTREVSVSLPIGRALYAWLRAQGAEPQGSEWELKRGRVATLFAHYEEKPHVVYVMSCEVSPCETLN